MSHLLLGSNPQWGVCLLDLFTDKKLQTWLTTQRPSSHTGHPHLSTTQQGKYVTCPTIGPEHYAVVIVEASQPLVAKISKINKIELEACGAGHILRRPWGAREKPQTYNLSLPLPLTSLEILYMSVIFWASYLLDEKDNTSLTCKEVKVL